jgi:hypothetical protein
VKGCVLEPVSARVTPHASNVADSVAFPAESFVTGIVPSPSAAK